MLEWITILVYVLVCTLYAALVYSNISKGGAEKSLENSRLYGVSVTFYIIYLVITYIFSGIFYVSCMFLVAVWL